MKKWGLLTLAVLMAAAAIDANAQGAPFCLVSNSGNQNCIYQTLDQCQSAQRYQGGICSPNSNQSIRNGVFLVDKALNNPDFPGSFQKGYAFGAEQRRLEEEHQAKVRLLEAQAQAENHAKTVKIQRAPGSAAWLVDGCRALSDAQDGTAVLPINPEEEGAYLASAGLCGGYISGYISAHDLMVKKGSKPIFCVPREIQTSQIGRVLVNKLDASPNFENIDASVFVGVVIQVMWPCK